MKLRSFKVEPKATYGEDKDVFVASICVEGDHSWEPSIKIELTHEQIEPILGIIHAAVVKNLDESVVKFRKAVMAKYGPAIEGQAQTVLEDQSE